MGFSSELSGDNPQGKDLDNNYMMRPIEGSMLLADKVNQAYMKSVFNDTYVISGMQFMPFKPKVRAEAEKAINCIGDIVYPVMTCLSLPIFMYNLVLEKETKLIQNMKINGMKMSNYWFVTGIFNFGMYCIIMLCYYGFGRFVSGLSFFTESDPWIMFHMYLGWGLNQVSQSFLFSCFLQDSQSA